MTHECHRCLCSFALGPALGTLPTTTLRDILRLPKCTGKEPNSSYLQGTLSEPPLTGNVYCTRMILPSKEREIPFSTPTPEPFQSQCWGVGRLSEWHAEVGPVIGILFLGSPSQFVFSLASFQYYECCRLDAGVVTPTRKSHTPSPVRTA